MPYMKQQLIIIFLLISLTYFGCNGQAKKLSMAQVKFESIFGYPEDSSCVYCLLGSGFFRAPRADNTDSLINDWKHKHPSDILLHISILKDESKMTYCWAIDNNDTLNIILIRNGCYPGGTMLGSRKNTSISEVYISLSTYDTFIEQLKSAETFAKNNKLGIWAKKELNE